MIAYLSVEEVIAMHDAFLQKFGGLPGIRDINLLMSAVETPKSRMFGQDLYPTVYDKAAAYLYHIICNHPFNDGNKRTGFGSALLFLKANSIPIVFDKKKYENLVVEVANGKVKKEEIARFLEHGK
jgi:death-on-curing protein